MARRSRKDFVLNIILPIMKEQDASGKTFPRCVKEVSQIIRDRYGEPEETDISGKIRDLRKPEFGQWELKSGGENPHVNPELWIWYDGKLRCHYLLGEEGNGVLGKSKRPTKAQMEELKLELRKSKELVRVLRKRLYGGS